MLADKKLLQQQITHFEALLNSEQYEEAIIVCFSIEQHLMLFQLQDCTPDFVDHIRALKSLFDNKIEELKKKRQQIQITVASLDQFRSNKVSEAYQKNNY